MRQPDGGGGGGFGVGSGGTILPLTGSTASWQPAEGKTAFLTI